MALQVQEVQRNPGVPRFVKAAKTDEVNPGNCISAKLEGNFIGIHNVNGKYYAVNNICPHVGGILHAGAARKRRYRLPNPSMEVRCQNRQVHLAPENVGLQPIP